MSCEVLILLSYTFNVSPCKKIYVMHYHKLLREEDQKALRDEKCLKILQILKVKNIEKED